MTSARHLRPIRLDELELMLSWRNSPAVRSNMYTTHEIPLSEHLTWWQRTSERADQQYFMYEAATVPRGIVAFTRIDLENANCSWAFYADPTAPKGTGSHMEFLALEHAFGPLDMHRLHCEVLDFNTPVLGLHQKFGFQVEGRLRQQHRREDGYSDIVLLGILRSEWQAHREGILARLRNNSKSDARI